MRTRPPPSTQGKHGAQKGFDSTWSSELTVGARADPNPSHGLVAIRVHQLLPVHGIEWDMMTVENFLILKVAVVAGRSCK